MQPFPRLRSALAYLVQGPPDLPQSLQLEWRFVVVRWLGILSVGPGLQFANISPDQLRDAYLVLAVAGVYNVAIQVTMPRRPGLFASGYLTSLGDALLNIAMVEVGGGFNTPFYYLLFTVTISAAMRYGYGPSLGMAAMYVVFDLAEGLSQGRELGAPFFFRSGFLFITALLAAYLREIAHRAELALQDRLRQADLLNEATAMLGSSLEFERVLQAVAAAATQVLGGEEAVLLPAADLEGDDAASSGAVHYPDADDGEVRHDLEKLCRRYIARYNSPGDDKLLYRETLASGQEALALIMTLPTRRTPLATLTLASLSGRGFAELDRDILDSFMERITLAIENGSLYRALGLRSKDLQRAYSELALAHQELLSLDEMKTNFLANVSHELRTPLTSIRAFSELLLTYEGDAEGEREFLGIINSESERLTRLVNDVLDITKIESGHMDWHMATVDLATLARESARIYGPLVQQRQLVFEEDIADEVPRAHGDRDRLQQVIGNLLNNAVKFTRGGGIRLSVRCEDDQIYVSVSDTGIGIGPEDQERIFEKFHQVGDTLTDKPKGTGLGLSICRDIIAHHKGRLWVESQIGGGSTFTFTLPVAVEPARQS